MTEQEFKTRDSWFEVNPKRGLIIHAMLLGGWCVKDWQTKPRKTLCQGSFDKCYEYYTTQKSEHAYKLREK